MGVTVNGSVRQNCGNKKITHPVSSSDVEGLPKLSEVDPVKALKEMVRRNPGVKCHGCPALTLGRCQGRITQVFGSEDAPEVEITPVLVSDVVTV